MRILFERLATFSLLLLVMGSFTSLFLGSDLRENTLEVANSQRHLGLDLLEVVIYGVCAYFFLTAYRRTIVALWAAWPFLLMVLFAFLSTGWSVDPASTFRRAAVLFATTVFGAYLGGRYSVEEFQGILLQSLVLMVSASLVLVVLRPAAVFDPSHPGTFRGLTEHKNIFAEYMGTLLFLGLTYTFKVYRITGRIITILVALSMLAWAHSGTALLSIVTTLIVVPFLYLLRFRKIQMVPVAVIGFSLLLGLLVYFSTFSDQVLSALGKDPTLTGRTVIWSLVWKAILRRPLLGYGYDAFWQGLRGESLSVVSVVGWNVPHSHNGYLEALLGFGVVGSTVIAMAVLRTAYDSLCYVRLRRSTAGLWPSAFLFCFLAHAVAEAGFIKRDGLAYLLLVTISTSLAISRTQARAPQKEGLSYAEGDFSFQQEGLSALSNFQST